MPGDIIASTIAPADPREAAIVARLAPGNYTAIVSGVNNTTGVGLVESYTLDTNNSRAANISTRRTRRHWRWRSHLEASSFPAMTRNPFLCGRLARR